MHRTLARPTACVATPVPIVRFAVPLDENGFVDWLSDANPGERVAYYRGHLGHDRMPSAHVLDERARIILQAVANRVMSATAHELVLPVQRRIGPDDFVYFAVKTRSRRPASADRLAAMQLSHRSSNLAKQVPLAA